MLEDYLLTFLYYTPKGRCFQASSYVLNKIQSILVFGKNNIKIFSNIDTHNKTVPLILTVGGTVLSKQVLR